MPSRVKRIFDFAVAAMAVILLSLVLLPVAFAVLLSMGRPILFHQLRPGLHGNPFRIYKFRTMTNERDAAGKLLPDEQRLTRVGRFLRATTIDELPELFNVLKGDMSLVGPRPLLMSYLERYSPEQARRHEVKPGLTGWAVVNGRNALSWEEKFALDVWYVDNQSFWLDIKIIWKTVVLIVKGEGVSAAGHATMPEFQGSVVKK